MKRREFIQASATGISGVGLASGLHAALPRRAKKRVGLVAAAKWPKRRTSYPLQEREVGPQARVSQIRSERSILPAR